MNDLSDATRALVRAYRYLERSLDGLSMADFRLLAALAEGEERATRLAHRLALGKPAISATVESLVKRGLIIRSKVDGDNRAVSLALTAEGSTLFAETDRRLTERLGDLLAHVEHPESVRASLVELGAGFDAVMSERTAAK